MNKYTDVLIPATINQSLSLPHRDRFCHSYCYYACFIGWYYLYTMIGDDTTKLAPATHIPNDGKDKYSNISMKLGKLDS